MATNRGADSRSIADILADLKNEIVVLLREELNLARVELTDKSRRARRGASSAAIGGVLALGGFFALVAAAILALDLALEAPWLSSLVVGFVLVVIGIIGLSAARRQFEDLAPRETAESLRRSMELIEKRVPERPSGTSSLTPT